MNINYGIVVAGVVLILAALVINGGPALSEGWWSSMLRHLVAAAFAIGGSLTILYAMGKMVREKDYLTLLALGAIVAKEMGYTTIPIVHCDVDGLPTDTHVDIDVQGRITMK